MIKVKIALILAESYVSYTDFHTLGPSLCCIDIRRRLLLHVDGCPSCQQGFERRRILENQGYSCNSKKVWTCCMVFPANTRGHGVIQCNVVSARYGIFVQH